MQYHCNYCQEDIGDVRVRCFECKDFDLCLQCFSCGAEVGSHKNKHSYQLIDCGNFPVFGCPNDWKAQEELKLLDAVEQYGFGNWADCAADLERTAEEIETHYSDMYIHGAIGKKTWKIEDPPKIHDQTIQDEGQFVPNLSVPLPPLMVTSQEQQELGYLPNRDDFEREYDNDAESLVSNLVINNDDDNLDTAFKLAFIGMYTNTIEERIKRKKIAREHGLVNKFFSTSNKQKLQNFKKKSSKEEDRDCQETMLALSRFLSTYEQEQLAKNLQRERELKQRIKELYRCRKNGVAKLQDCAEFEMARYKKEKKENGKLPVVFFVPRRLLMELKEEEDESGDIILVERQKKDDTLKQTLFGRHYGLFQLTNVLEKKARGSPERTTG